MYDLENRLWLHEVGTAFTTHRRLARRTTGLANIIALLFENVDVVRRVDFDMHLYFWGFFQTRWIIFGLIVYLLAVDLHLVNQKFKSY